MDWLADILFGWFFDLMYLLQSGICVVIDFIVQTFYKLSGLESVVVDGQETDLLSHFIQTPAIRTAFLGVFLVGVILLCVFVLIAIIRSEYADAQHKKTKGQILAKAGQSFIIFLIIPLLLTTGIMLTNAVMSAINGSMLAGVSGGGSTSFGGQILTTSGYNAYTGPAGKQAEIEQMFLTGQLDYTKLKVVKQYYDVTEMNFFIGIFSGLILVVMFALAALRFVQRIFDVILLYVISPASVATIPVDEGARFKLWREMLISKVLSAYGIIFAMNLFFLIVPQINRIQFFDNGFQNGLIGLLVIIGGAFAVTKAYMVIAQLTGANAGAQEAQQTMAGIYSGIRMARGAVRMASGAVGQVIGGSDFRSNQRKGMGWGENMNASIHSTRNQHVTNNADAKSEREKANKNKQNNGISPGDSQRDNNTSQYAAERDKQATFGVDKDTRQAHSESMATDGGQSTYERADTVHAPLVDKDGAQVLSGTDTQSMVSGSMDDNADTRHNADQTSFTGKDAQAMPDTNTRPLTADDTGRTAATDTEGTANERNDSAPVSVMDKDNAQIMVKGDTSDRLTAGQKTAHFFGGVGRLATLPAGVLKDMLQGGAITTAKNMWPRLKNVATGKGIINHADVKPKLPKTDTPKVQAATAIKPEAAPAKPAQQPKPVNQDKKDGDKK